MSRGLLSRLFFFVRHGSNLRNGYNLQPSNFCYKRRANFFETEIHTHCQMPLFEKRIGMPPVRLGQRKLEFEVNDSVRVRVGTFCLFRNATIIDIDKTTMTIQ
jgi:hypothetical protein